MTFANSWCSLHVLHGRGCRWGRLRGDGSALRREFAQALGLTAANMAGLFGFNRSALVSGKLKAESRSLAAMLEAILVLRSVGNKSAARGVSLTGTRGEG